MANFKEVLVEALNRGVEQKMFGVNRGLMEVALSTKKKPGFVKIAIDDETAKNIMARQKYASFLLCFDGDLLNQIANELDGEGPEAIDSTESA